MDNLLLMKAIKAELEAIDLYEELAQNSKNEKVKKVLKEVIEEEKIHVWEFLKCLEAVDAEFKNLEGAAVEELKDLNVVASQLGYDDLKEDILGGTAIFKNYKLDERSKDEFLVVLCEVGEIFLEKGFKPDLVYLFNLAKKVGLYDELSAYLLDYAKQFGAEDLILEIINKK